jgi:hypothetical protein
MSLDPSMRTPNFKDASSQELVDVYVVHAPAEDGSSPDPQRLSEAAEAAFELETRGYVEQAGTWLHAEDPPLRPSPNHRSA